MHPAAQQKPRAEPLKPPPVTLDIATMPILNRTAENARADLVEYVDTMTRLHKPLREIHLRPSSYRAICDSIRTVRRKVDRDAPPPGRIDLPRHSGDPLGTGGSAGR